jgi:mono/diheme cytochrome c family protein
MRHILANIVTYAIAALLFVGAALFAWTRSAQVAVTTEAAMLAGYEPADSAFRWGELGRAGYVRNCRNCHGADGEGWDQYPGLGGAGATAAGVGGREYLVDVHLYGLASDRWGAPMPPMGHIRDVELAAILNYILTAFGDAETAPLFVPADIADRRRLRLSPGDVDRRRPDAVEGGGPVGPPPSGARSSQPRLRRAPQS